MGFHSPFHRLLFHKINGCYRQYLPNTYFVEYFKIINSVCTREILEKFHLYSTVFAGSLTSEGQPRFFFFFFFFAEGSTA